MSFRPQDICGTHVCTLGVDYSLVSLMHPHIATLPDDARDIYKNIQLERDWRRFDYLAPTAVISLMLTAPEFQPCSPQRPARFGRTHISRRVQTWMVNFDQADFTLFVRVHSEELWARHGGWDSYRMHELADEDKNGNPRL